MNAYEIITLACKGNKDAENFCKAWVEFCHTLDDCVDRDKPLSPSAVARAFTAYTLELAGNPFFQVNKGVLVGLMVQSANYWVASHDRSPTERDITKCFWHSVIYEVAHLVGGWDHMAEVTRKTLEFDYELNYPPDRTSEFPPVIGIREDGRCDCNGGTPCPIRKTGSMPRCTREELDAHRDWLNKVAKSPT
jgi:hypothetical protein